MPTLFYISNSIMNLKRIVFGADYTPSFISGNFTEVKTFFKNLKKIHTKSDDMSWWELTAIYLYIYDDRYSVEEEMGWDIIVVDNETDESVDHEHWAQRLPWQFYCQPLDLKEFLTLNKEYCNEICG